MSPENYEKKMVFVEEELVAIFKARLRNVRSTNTRRVKVGARNEDNFYFLLPRRFHERGIRST